MSAAAVEITTATRAAAVGTTGPLRGTTVLVVPLATIARMTDLDLAPALLVSGNELLKCSN